MGQSQPAVDNLMPDHACFLKLVELLLGNLRPGAFTPLSQSTGKVVACSRCPFFCLERRILLLKPLDQRPPQYSFECSDRAPPWAGRAGLGDGAVGVARPGCAGGVMAWVSSAMSGLVPVTSAASSPPPMPVGVLV